MTQGTTKKIGIPTWDPLYEQESMTPTQAVIYKTKLETPSVKVNLQKFKITSEAEKEHPIFHRVGSRI
jgi:hypothetical protein